MSDPFYKLHRSRNRGFVLLLVLALLTLAALAVVAMSRASIARVQAADDAQTELQRRWGALSCQEFLLPEASALVERASRQGKTPPGIWRHTLRLGNQAFDLLFQDESSKANVSTLVQRQGRERAELTIRRLCLASPFAAGNVHLRSETGHRGPESFGEVFDKITPSALFDGSFGPPPAETFTCWGDGRLNIHSATEGILRELCEGVLDMSQIHALVGLQQTDPKISLGEALARLQVRREKRGAAEQLLTESSNCWSLWIDCKTMRRSYWTLAVTETGQKVRVFEW